MVEKSSHDSHDPVPPAPVLSTGQAGMGESLASQTKPTGALPPDTLASGAPAASVKPAPPTQPTDPVRVRIDPDVSFTTLQVAGVTVVRCAHAGTGQHFQFGTSEHHVAQMLNGERTVTQIVELTEADGLDWTPEEVAEFIGVLVKEKIAIVSDKKSGATPQVPPPPVLASSQGGMGESLTTKATSKVPPPCQGGMGESPTKEATSETDSQSENLVTPPEPTALAAGTTEFAEPPSQAEQNTTPKTNTAVQPQPTPSPTSLLTTPPPSSAPPTPQPPKPPSPIVVGLIKVCGWLISIRIPLLNADPVASAILPAVGWLHATRGMFVAWSFIIVSMAFAFTQQRHLATELMRLFDSQLWITMLVVWAVMKVFHELGHATAAKAHGVHVGRAGIMFFLFAPLAYVDVTNAWSIPRKRSRIAIALAGVYIELICASFAIWVWWANPGGLTAHLAAQVFFLAGPATLLVNANPLLRLDGYYVLSDLVDIPNLRQQGRQLVGAKIEARLFGIPASTNGLSDWRRLFAAVHAIASIVFQIVWMGGLVIVVSMWAGPFGLLVSGGALAMWVFLPTIRWCKRIWTYQGTSSEFNRGEYRKRVLWSAMTVLMLAQFLVTLPSPLSRQVPVVVRFANDEVIRSPISGFVKRVRLHSGDFVHAGELILELEDRELEMRRDSIADELEAENIRRQRYERQQQLGLADASKQNAASLQRRLAELDAEVALLRVSARKDGEILTPQLSQLEGRFVDQGTQLVQIGVKQRKELLISVGEDELDAYHEAIEQAKNLQVCFRGGQVIEIIPQDLRPSASRRVSHPALAATAGGYLPVQPVSNAGDSGEDVEWISPRFEAIVQLPVGVSNQIRSGEIGQLALRDQRSLFTRFWQWLGP